MKSTATFFVFLLFFIASHALHASHLPATLLKEPVTLSPRSPHKASIWAATIPGAGQLYNHKYWKVPIVYGGMATLGFFIYSNQKNFKAMQTELTARNLNDSSAMNPKYALFPVAYLRSERNYYRNNRDLSIVGLFAFYALTIVDAAVDAHLYQFDVNKSLSLHAKPSPVWSQNGVNAALNMGLCFRF